MICCKSIVYLVATTSARRAPGDISQYLPTLCMGERETKREAWKREGEGGEGWNYVLSFIFERAQLWTLCSSTCRLFSALACQRCIGLLTPPAPSREREYRGNNVRRGERRAKRFCGIRVLELNARKKGKNGHCEVENWSGRAHLRAIVPWMTDLLTMLRDNFAR